MAISQIAAASCQKWSTFRCSVHCVIVRWKLSILIATDLPTSWPVLLGRKVIDMQMACAFKKDFSKGKTRLWKKKSESLRTQWSGFFIFFQELPQDTSGNDGTGRYEVCVAKLPIKTSPFFGRDLTAPDQSCHRKSKPSIRDMQSQINGL